MALIAQDALERLTTIVRIGKTVFHYAFIPTVIYLGFTKGADPGMPPLAVTNLLW